MAESMRAHGGGAGGDGTAGPDNDWTVQATDTVERLVGTVKARTTGPALLAARAVVYGLLGAILGITVVVLLAIAVVRFLDAYLPQEVWLAHLIVGVLFTAGGLLLWRGRRTRVAH